MDERTPWLDAEAKSLGLQTAGKDDAVLRDIEGQQAETPDAGNLGDGPTGELAGDPASQADAAPAPPATGHEPASLAELALSELLSDLGPGDQSPDQPAAGTRESVVPPPEQLEASRDAALADAASAAPVAAEASEGDAPTSVARPRDEPDDALPPAAPWDIAATATHAAHDDEPGRAVPPADDFGFDELEDGIASIFAALHAEGGATAESDESDDGREPADDAVTFLLLGELDRLWHRPGR